MIISNSITELILNEPSKCCNQINNLKLENLKQDKKKLTEQ